uniref:Non-structural replication polyprotein n=1 Tax=Chiltepin yellow mosaic virus TaxID=688701 RepID=D6CFX1_9VIRU|nr:RNA-dependent RNA polymerase [Chiltepin yellow mosaic virus]
MAFQLALDALSSTTHRDASLNPVLNSAVQPLQDSLQHYPWIIPKEHLPFLISSGIPVSGFGTTPHPHAVHKTIETFLLFNHWSHLASTPSSVMFMKPSKFRKLPAINPNFQELINYRLTPADTVRYPTTSTTLPTNDCVFMHDALMYFNPSQIVDLFLNSPNLETLYCSLICPAESHFTDLSLYPEIYTYKISGQTLHYVPESHHAGSYNQPLQALSWLKVNSISHPEILLSVTKLESWGPVHSLLIQRGLPPLASIPRRALPPLGRAPQTPQDHLLQNTAALFHQSQTTESLVSFQIPDCLELPQATFLRQPLRHRLVPSAVYNALFTYTRAVRTLRTSDPAGFVRTQSNKPEYSWVTPSAWDNLQTFALLNSPHRPQVCYHFFSSPIDRLKLYFGQHWRAYLLFLTPFLSTSPLLLPLFNFKFPLPIPKLLSVFRKRFASPLLLTSYLPNEIQLPFPLMPKIQLFPKHQTCHLLQRFHRTLHRANLLPLPPILPQFEFRTATIMELIPRPRIVLPLLSLILASPPLITHILQAQTPQTLHDNYHLHLHPSKFLLQWNLQSFQLNSHQAEFQHTGGRYKALKIPSKFLLQWNLQSFQVTSTQPFLPYQLQAPPPAASSLPPARPVFHATPPVTTQRSNAASPATHVPCQPSSSSTTPQDREPSNASKHSIWTVPMDGPNVILPTPAPEPTPLNLVSSPPLENNHPIHTQQPLQSTVLPSGALTFDVASTPSTSLNSTPTPAVAKSSLADDPTAVGLAAPFSKLFPAEYFPLSAELPTRSRHVPSSNLPLAKNLTAYFLPSLTWTSIPISTLWETLQSKNPRILFFRILKVENLGLSTDILTALCYFFHCQCALHTPQGVFHYGIMTSSRKYRHLLRSRAPTPFLDHSTHYCLSSSLQPHPGATGASSATFQVQIDAFLPFTQAHSHTSSLHHAKNLISNMKNGFDGILSTIAHSNSGPSPRQRMITLDSLVDVAAPRTIPVIHIAGFAGCGKTLPVQHLLKTKHFHDFRVSCPTNELRSEWKRDMQPTAENLWRFSTWESSLLKTSSVLVIDEIYKLPRGYLDLSIIADPSLRLVIILGDPLQGEYHSTSPHSSNHFLPSEIHRFKSYIDCYCFWSYRIPTSFARMFGVSSFSKEPGFVRTLTTHPPNGKNLTNAINTALTLQEMGHHAITISSSQGTTFQEAHTILLDRHTNRLSPNNCLVALTRSKVGVYFVGNLHLASNDFGTNYLFSQFLAGKDVDLHQLFPYVMPYLPKLHEPIKSRSIRFVAGLINPSINFSILPRLSRPIHLPPHIPVDYKKDFLISNPIVAGNKIDERLDTHYLPPTRLPLHFDLPPGFPQPATFSESAPQPTNPLSLGLFGFPFETLAAFFLPAHDPEIKEIIYSDQKSNPSFPLTIQRLRKSFTPTKKAINFLFLTDLLSSPANPLLYWHQSTLPLMIQRSFLPLYKKRLRFRASSKPYSICPTDVILGQHLYFSWCSAYSRPTSQVLPFNPELFAECINLNEYAQLSSKTRSTLVANAQRSDPDWRYTSVRIFAKAQHKVNDSSIFSNWKACQTLALMHDYIILVLGPVKKYQRIYDQRERPPQIYYHCGHTPTQLSQWCSQHLQSPVATTNDYTAFDQSQHGEAVVFECFKMNRLPIPPHLISLHSHLKCSIETQFGPLTCMRLTGEPGTYDDNSDYNLAVIYSQYAIKSEAIMISGDDSVIDGVPPINPNWSKIAPLLHLRFKTEKVRHPLFCGYYVTPVGACRDPEALFAKLMICIDDGSFQDKVLSYLSEFSIGHSLGDVLLQRLHPDLLIYQTAVHDCFCRRCSPSQKMILSLDPIPESKLLLLLRKVKWASSQFFSQLPQKARDFLTAKSQLSSFHQDPKVSQLESELLLSLN